MIPPVLCIVGPSDSGKTLVAEALICSLSTQGYRIAAVKHCPHGYSLDKPGSDSDRFKAAGATRVGLVSLTEWAVLERLDGDDTLERIVQHVGVGCDLVLAEGFRSSIAPKVLVLPKAIDPTWEFPQGIIALVSHTLVPEAQWQCRFEELERLATFVRDRFPKIAPEGARMSLVVDGKDISLNTFASSVFANTVWGMISSLKGIPLEASELRLEIRGRFSGRR